MYIIMLKGATLCPEMGRWEFYLGSFRRARYVVILTSAYSKNTSALRVPRASRVSQHLRLRWVSRVKGKVTPSRSEMGRRHGTN
jgi:hypothetical protein